MGRVTVRRRWLVLAAALLTAGCGAQHHNNSLPGFGTAANPAPPTAAAVTNSALLESKLLTPADLPPGFTHLDPGMAPGGPPPQDKSHTTPADCANVLAAVSDQVAGSSANAAVHYQDSNFSSVDIDAASYPNGAAAQAFSRVQQLVRQCRSYSGTDADGSAISYRVGALDQPVAGAASVSFQVRTTSQGISLYSAATLALVGSTVVQIADSGTNKVDAALLSDLTDKQVRALEGVDGP